MQRLGGGAVDEVLDRGPEPRAHGDVVRLALQRVPGHLPGAFHVRIRRSSGGVPAGLQSALTLGRMHRRVLLVDSGDYRNGAARHLHNLITLDGVPPQEFRARAHADLGAYDTVTLHRGRVSTIEGTAGRWVARTQEGYAVRAAAVILATSGALTDRDADLDRAV